MGTKTQKNNETLFRKSYFSVLSFVLLDIVPFKGRGIENVCVYMQKTASR